MEITFLPKTKLGSFSLVLFIIMIVLLAFFFLLIGVFDQRGGDTFFSNLFLTIPMIAAWASGLAALIVGLVDILKSKSKAILVFAVITFSFLTTLFGIIEVTSPH